MCSSALLPCYPRLLYQTKTMLGDHLTNVGINRDNVSEVLQMYMGAHCANTELAPLALSLKTKAFQAHTPVQKASILGFLANELACSRTVIRYVKQQKLKSGTIQLSTVEYFFSSYTQ